MALRSRARNFTGSASWNSTADGNGQEASSSFSGFDITTHAHRLRPGKNVLAIQVLNQGTGSSDLIIQPKLLAGVEAQGVASLEFGALDFNPSSGNQDQEYIQLTNPGTDAVDISGWQLRGGVEHTFVPGTVVAANSSLYVTPDVVAFRARTAGPRGGQSLFVQGGMKGHLSNFGETIQLLRDDNSLVAEKTYVGDPTAQQKYLRVSEIMYNPMGPSEEELHIVPDADAQSFEFVELVNTADDELSLAGVRFTGGVDFAFADGPVRSLGPGERVVVVRDRQAFVARYGDAVNASIAGEFQNFSQLDNNGERIKLEDASNSTIVDFAYGDDPEDGWALRADGHGSSLQIINPSATLDAANWRASTTIQGTPGTPDPETIDGVMINEILAHTDLPSVDAIELHNVSNLTIDLNGYFLSDSSRSIEALAKFAIPNQTLAANGFLVFDENDFNKTQGADPQDFALDAAHGDQVYLTAGQEGPEFFVDFVNFGATANGESIGRLVSATEHIGPMRSLTLGEINSPPRVGPVVITEVHYHPSEPSTADLAIDPGLEAKDLEFVEISNTGGIVDLTQWRIRQGIDFDFADGLQLDRGQSLIIVPFEPGREDNAARLAAFRNHYQLDENVVIVGGYSGQLSNGGELVQLQRPDSPPVDEPDFIPRLLEDEVLYDDVAPWPLADGNGNSLQRVGDSFGNLAASWFAQPPTPGAFIHVDPPGDFNNDGVINDLDIDLLTAGIRNHNLDFDLTADHQIDDADLRFMVEEILQTHFGDSNLDGQFDTTDLIKVFQIGEFEDGLPMNSTWADGDWNGDQEFGTGDLILAFQSGGFLRAARTKDAPAAALLDRVQGNDKHQNVAIHATPVARVGALRAADLALSDEYDWTIFEDERLATLHDDAERAVEEDVEAAWQ